MIDQTWITRGFDAFRQGSFSNAGHNLYVSKAGVLQRIHLHDFNGDGYFDLVFCNSQNHWERVPTYVFQDVLNPESRSLLELPSDGALSGIVADLNGNGFDDLVLGCYDNGISLIGINSIIYFGSKSGWSESRQQRLPTPACRSVTAGDFNGDQQLDLAFLGADIVRVFYQSELGFEPKRYVELDIKGDKITQHDLDQDGYADLIVRSRDGSITVYWGGPNGLDPDERLEISTPDNDFDRTRSLPPSDVSIAEWVEDATPLVQVIELPTPHVFVAQEKNVLLIPISKQRHSGPPITLKSPASMAISTGDVNGDGMLDLVIACRDATDGHEHSWIYWGSKNGFCESHKTQLASYRACDVAVTDLDGDGFDEVILCQNKTHQSFTSESLIYRGCHDGIHAEPTRLVSHDARQIFVAFSDAGCQPQVVLINHFARTCIDNVEATIYHGGTNGFHAKRFQHLDASGAVEAIGCDINDNSHADLVLCNASEYSRVQDDRGSFVYLGGDNNFSEHPDIVLPTTHAHGCCCADLNHDGYLDLIFCGFSDPDLMIFYGTADGFDTKNPSRLRMERDGVVYNEPRWIYLADLNNNGWLDLVVPQIAFDRSFILWGGPHGYSMDRCQMLSIFHAACVRAADFTGNGYADLVIGGHLESPGEPDDCFVYIYWNGPEGLSEDRRMLLPAKAVNSMAIADFNNNGRLDLFVTSYGSERERDIHSYLYWNRKETTFSVEDRTLLFTHSASGCVAADFNENGWTDLAVANHKVWGDHVGFSEVWWNSSDGFDKKNTTRLPTEGPHGMSSVEPANIMDRGPNEYYISTPFQLPEAARATAISWQAQIPNKTWVRAQVRFGITSEALENSTWQGPSGVCTWFENGQEILPSEQTGEWIQYRLALGAVNGLSTPRVHEVVVHYSNP